MFKKHNVPKNMDMMHHRIIIDITFIYNQEQHTLRIERKVCPSHLGRDEQSTGNRKLLDESTKEHDQIEFQMGTCLLNFFVESL